VRFGMETANVDFSDNVCVHRAAANRIDFRTDAARRSVCNTLLCHQFSPPVPVQNQQVNEGC
jgi:hypothetical protein